MAIPNTLKFQFKEPKEMFTYHLPGTFKDIINLLCAYDDFDNMDREFTVKIESIEKSDKDRIYNVCFQRDPDRATLSEKSVKKLIGCFDHLEMFNSLVYGFSNMLICNQTESDFFSQKDRVFCRIEKNVIQDSIKPSDFLLEIDNKMSYLDTIKKMVKNVHLNKALFQYLKPFHFEKMFYDDWTNNISIFVNWNTLKSLQSNTDPLKIKNLCFGTFCTQESVRKFLILFIKASLNFCAECAYICPKIDNSLLDKMKSSPQCKDDLMIIFFPNFPKILFVDLFNYELIESRRLIRDRFINSNNEIDFLSFLGSELCLKKWLFDDQVLINEVHFLSDALKNIWNYNLEEELISVISDDSKSILKRLVSYCNTFLLLLTRIIDNDFWEVCHE